MGRYYTGDINGKFWFGVQDSNDASFFGGEEIEPNYITYYFDKEHLETIEEGIKKCNTELKDYRTKLDDLFKEHSYFNDKLIAETLGIREEKINYLLEWYARLLLGEKILEQVKKEGVCEFKAEL